MSALGEHWLVRGDWRNHEYSRGDVIIPSTRCNAFAFLGRLIMPIAFIRFSISQGHATNQRQQRNNSAVYDHINFKLGIKCCLVGQQELQDRISSMFPNKKIDALKNTWKRPLSPSLREFIARKSRSWTRYMETRDASIYKKYKSVRN